MAGANGHSGQDGNGGFQQFPSPLGTQQFSWRVPLGHNGRDPLPWFVPTASLPTSLLPWSAYLSLGQCTPERCWVRTPNYSLPVSHSYPYLFCAYQNRRIKNCISNFSSPVRNIAYRKYGCYRKQLFFFLIKIIKTKLFKEHFQFFLKKQPPALDDGKCRGIFVATQRR